MRKPPQIFSLALLALLALIAFQPTEVYAGRCRAPLSERVAAADAIVVARVLAVEGDNITFEVLERLEGPLNVGERFSLDNPPPTRRRAPCRSSTPPVGARRVVFAAQTGQTWRTTRNVTFMLARPRLLRSLRAYLESRER